MKGGECYVRKWTCLSGMSRIVITVFLPIVVLLSILQIYTFHKAFYLKEYQKYNVSENTKIAQKDLEIITEKIINYLKGKEDDLHIRVKINNQMEEVFGEREKQHMIDVKELFQKGYILRNMAALFSVMAVMILVKGSKNMHRDIYQSFFNASILSLAAMVLLLLLIQIDFYKYFTYFHEIFFDNDLWQLDPKKDLLIQMLPLGFFIDIAIKVIISFIAMMGGIGALSFQRLRQCK